MQVRITEPALVDGLIDVFRQNDCVAQPVSRDSCIVVHLHANSADEARRELEFFLRAWQIAHPGVSAVVTS